MGGRVGAGGRWAFERRSSFSRRALSPTRLAGSAPHPEPEGTHAHRDPIQSRSRPDPEHPARPRRRERSGLGQRRGRPAGDLRRRRRQRLRQPSRPGVAAHCRRRRDAARHGRVPDGSFTATLSIPANTPAGDHTVVAIAASGTAEAALTVTAASGGASAAGLPPTGAMVGWGLLVIALLALAAGRASLGFARRFDAPAPI